MKKLEPWDTAKCSVCKKEYHIADMAACKCGIKESKALFKQHLGEYVSWISKN